MAWRPADRDARSIFLVDDWPGYRRSLRLFLEASGHHVCGEAGAVDQAVGRRGLHQAQVVVLEPEREWEDLERDLTKLRSAAPAAGIVLLSSAQLPRETVLNAIRAGIGAYVSKVVHPDELLRAIGAASSRGHVMLPRRLFPAPDLTRREQEVLMLAAASFSEREIADTLYVTGQTVRFHLGNVYSKLGVTSRAAAISAATGLGLLG
jgi:DNA-binding NarL/FixJ family response regulator